ncbi:thioredoxin family protein [Aestuariibaculum suncheonense]|uniref:Thioredoxin family protein n=1 Tax=Aestuariibaculum suncheonense TaxID=1028745 RepID=A0A8J6Q6N7_9FLAO|nr:thioredoxin family protein [Aestuariibaculum suncheonense]MBD0835658.1 thioredoxin family protein [Aestuariibaculum suncheonense]
MRTLVNLFTIIVLLVSCKKEANETLNEIDFKSGSFSELKEIAKQENKLIFIDCYTSWCAPCKWMDKNVFVKKDVFEFYNASFINTKIDMEKGEGPSIAKAYGVTSFPTYLFINSEGELIHKSGSKMRAEAFIEQGNNALNPKKSLGLLEKKYESNNITNEEIVDYLLALNQIRAPKTQDILNDLLSRVDSVWLKSQSGWKLINSFVYEASSPLYHLLENNTSYFIGIAGQEGVNSVYQKVLQRRMYQSINDKNEALFLRQLDSLKQLTNNSRDLSIIHCSYYVNSGDANAFIETSNYYVDNFLQTDPETIAFIANSTTYKGEEQNKNILKQAGYLIGKAYNMNPNDYGIVGTYARINSLLGNKQEAVKAAKIAVKMADTISSKVKKRALQNLEAIENAQ